MRAALSFELAAWEREEMTEMNGISRSSLPFSASESPPRISELSHLKTQTTKHPSIDPALREAAEGMEAMFLDYMIQVMRETVPKSEMGLESPATQVYRSMLDSEYAQRISHQGGVGLADQIVAYLEARGYNQTRGQGVPTKEKP